MTHIQSKVLFIRPVTNLDIDEAKCYDSIAPVPASAAVARRRVLLQRTNLDIDEAKCYDGYLDLAVSIPPLSILNIDLSNEQNTNTPIHDCRHGRPVTPHRTPIRYEIHPSKSQGLGSLSRSTSMIMSNRKPQKFQHVYLFEQVRGVEE